MSVVLARNAQDFAHQVSSLADTQGFYDNLSMDSSRLTSNIVVGITNDNSCSSNSSSESHRNDETVSFNSQVFKSRACEYVEESLLEPNKSLLLSSSSVSDYDSHYKEQKDSRKSHLNVTENRIGGTERSGENADNSLCTRPSEPSDKEPPQNAPCSRPNYRNDGISESVNIVFVSGLNPETTVSQLVELFGGREVLKSNNNGEPDVHIHLDRMTGKSRGQATVAFRTSDLAQSAIKKLNDSEYLGGRLTVQPYRKKTWPSRRGPGFGYVREYLPCRCWDWPHHHGNDFYNPIYPDTRLSSRSYHGGYHGMSGYRSDVYDRMHCPDPYFQGNYSRNRIHRDDFQFQRYAPDMVPETNSGPYFHCHSRTSRPCWDGYQRNCFSMGGHGGFTRLQNNPRDFYPRSIYGRGRMSSESERSHKSWKMDVPHASDSNKYGDRSSYRAP